MSAPEPKSTAMVVPGHSVRLRPSSANRLRRNAAISPCPLVGRRKRLEQVRERTGSDNDRPLMNDVSPLPVSMSGPANDGHVGCADVDHDSMRALRSDRFAPDMALAPRIAWIPEHRPGAMRGQLAGACRSRRGSGGNGDSKPRASTSGAPSCSARAVATPAPNAGASRARPIASPRMGLISNSSWTTIQGTNIARSSEVVRTPFALPGSFFVDPLP